MKPSTCLSMLAAILAGCAAGDAAPTDTDGADTDVVGVWNPRYPDAAAVMGAPRELVPLRAVFHLHSPYSHDACDGAGYVDGALDTACRDQLRAALCTLRYDVAFVTDHPDYGDAQPWEDLFHPQPGDDVLRDGDDVLANVIACDEGRTVMWRAGFEDDLMPVAMRHHVVADTQETRHALMNGSDEATFAALREAGATVMLAHTEQRELETLYALQDRGLHAVEAFNVHAMFDPRIRSSALGLDATGWIGALGPFTRQEAGAQPDLLFLAVHGEQKVSTDKWDALLSRGPMMATAGADTHQNVLPTLLADGERVDSYRRGLRWFSTVLLAHGRALADVDEAVASRRAFIAFESLGTPAGFDVHLETEAGVVEMGGDSVETGTLVVACPTLASGSPRGDEAPEITVHVLKDGEPFQQGCGSWPAERGVYRVRVDMVPHHLRAFLGTAADDLVKSYPWLYSGAIRVAME